MRGSLCRPGSISALLMGGLLAGLTLWLARQEFRTQRSVVKMPGSLD